jgi:hypothetical protein
MRCSPVWLGDRTRRGGGSTRQQEAESGTRGGIAARKTEAHARSSSLQKRQGRSARVGKRRELRVAWVLSE